MASEVVVCGLFRDSVEWYGRHIDQVNKLSRADLQPKTRTTAGR